MKCPDGFKYIYKITNLVNGKVYIGQSNDPERRFQEHIRGDSGTVILHNAIALYGSENFKIEIIEGPTQSYDQKEIYWIDYFNSRDRNFGYNIATGGSSPPIIKGEDSFLSTFSDEQIEKILITLQDTNKTYSEISKEYNVSIQYIQYLNNGKCRKSDKFEYPIRKSKNIILPKEKIYSVIKDLMFTTKSTEDVRRNHHLSSRTIWEINTGQHRYSPKHIAYPIRNHNTQMSSYMLNKIIGELKYGEYRIRDLAKALSISETTLKKINIGKSNKIDGIDYPIRKNARSLGHRKRNYDKVPELESL